MTLLFDAKRPLLAAAMLAMTVQAAPVLAQSTPTAAELRIKKLEAEVQALQRRVFPGGDGKYFAPQVQPGQPAPAQVGTPATTPVTDLLTRVDALEAQLARLTAQNEETANKLAQLQAKVDAQPAPVPVPSAPTATTASTAVNLAAMSGTASAKPAAGALAGSKSATPSAQRVAAVQAVQRPQTDDVGDDEYSYGYRLYDAKLYPEAEQQLKLFLQKYPKHTRVSFARNLLGKTYLDDGNAREAASWFLQNYQAGKTGARAPDSLLGLAEAMRQMKDTSRACIALAQFADDYPAEAIGRLKAQYDATRKGVKCN